MIVTRFSWNTFVIPLLLYGLAWGAPDRVVITQKDEDAIQKLIDTFNEDIQRIVDPFSSSIPDNLLRQTQSYRQLLEYDSKLLPYLIRQCQIEAEGRVIVGSKSAGRKITSLEDLHQFQKERASRLKEGITP